MKKYIEVAVICLVCASIFYSCKQKNGQNPQEVNIEKADISTIDSLILVYSDLIKNDRENDELFYQRAKLYQRSGKILLAVQDMEKAVKYESGIFEYFNLLGDLYFDANNMKASLDAFEKSTKLNPSDDYALLKSGRIYLFKAEPVKAISYLNKALDINKYNPETYSFKALYYLQMKDTARAIDNLKTSVEVDPDYFNSWLDLGYLLSIKKDKTALLYFDNALRIEPQSIQALYNRGKYYQDLDSFNKAISDYESILNIVPDHKSANYNLGYIFYLKDDFQTAIQFFSTVISKDPKFSLAYFGRGLCYSQLKNKQMAKENFLRVLELDPDDEQALIELNKLK